jgi:molybdopterin-guanine dinucleotide biosynthesis protein A
VGSRTRPNNTQIVAMPPPSSKPAAAASPLDRHAIAGVILAGGLSRRMGGGDKTLLSLDGHPMLAHVIARLRPQVPLLAINANGEPERFKEFGLPVIADAGSDREGPLAGVLAGLVWAQAQPSIRAIVTVASDTPFLPLDLVPRLLEPGAPLVVAESHGRVHPTVALWPLDLTDAVATALAEDRRQAMAFVEGAHARLVAFPMADVHGQQVDPFFNANTPEELDWARGILQTSRS